MSETLFQKIIKEGKEKPRSSSWYRNKVKQLAISGGYVRDPEKLIREERRDSGKPKKEQDPNKLTRVLETGQIYMFDYDPKYQLKLPVYDKFPMVYVVKATDNGFYGLNLHYFNNKKRLIFLNDLKKRKVAKLLTGRTYRYITENKYMNGIFLKIDESEWEDASIIPVENFFTNINGLEVNIPKTIVWKGTDRMKQEYIQKERIITRII
jgi:hypothetical protein